MRKITPLAGLVILFFIHCHSASFAQIVEPSQLRSAVTKARDDINIQLDKARRTYDAEAEKLKQALIENLQVEESRARESGNTRLVFEIKNERERFSEDQTLPTVVSTKQYKESLNNAKEQLVRALQQASSAFTRNMMDEDAAALQEELQALSLTSVAIGNWAWGNNEIRIQSSGNFKEYDPARNFVSSGTWHEKTDGSFMLKHDNGCTSIMRINHDGKTGGAHCTSPAGQTHVVNLRKK